MHVARPTRKRVGFGWLLGLVMCVGCGGGSVFTPRPPRPIPVTVNYLPYLVKGVRSQFPPSRVLVLQPVDKRKPYPVKYGRSLPPFEKNTAILGILGLYSKEGSVRVNSTQLGAQRRMKAGIPNNPDIPRGIFLLPGLDTLVQDALASHFEKAGFAVDKTTLSSPELAVASGEPAHYLLGCTIEEFSLISLERRHEVQITIPLNRHIIYIPIRGPTRADVALALTLYHWPSGQVLWQGKVADSVDDPPLREHEFLYATPGEVLSMALSRAVGSILVSQSLQDVLGQHRLSVTDQPPAFIHAIQEPQGIGG